MIRNFIKDLGAENVVLELCEERYEDEIYDIISHPNYDRTFNQVHKLLSQKKPQRLLKFEDQIAVNQGNFEFMVGLDQCSYRMPCKTVLGDRNLSITQKRFQAKAHLLELYKEQMMEEEAGKEEPATNSASKLDKTTARASTENTGSSIFDLEEGTTRPVGLFTDPSEVKSQTITKKVESDIAKLKDAFKEIKEEKTGQTQHKLGIEATIADTIGKKMTESEKREAQKTEYDIYQEVFIDEVNQELLKNIQKCEGSIIVLLLRQERLKRFADVWQQANLDYYNSQTLQAKNLKKQSDLIVEPEQATKEDIEAAQQVSKSAATNPFSFFNKL